MSNGVLKKTKWLSYGLILLITVLIITIGLVAPESIKAISNFNINHSIAFITIRLMLYLIIYLKWSSIVHTFQPGIPQRVILRSRKKVLMLIVVYEVFVGFNIFKLLGV